MTDPTFWTAIDVYANALCWIGVAAGCVLVFRSKTRRGR